MHGRERQNVLERLQELEGWAEYIVEALHLNQQREPVKREMLERALGPDELRQLREQAWTLLKQLHRLTTTLEFSRRAEELIPADREAGLGPSVEE